MSPILRGLLLGIGSEAATALAVWIVLLVAGLPLAENVRWFALCFVPPVLILRHYANKKKDTNVTKVLITVLFVTFVAFMFLIAANR